MASVIVSILLLITATFAPSAQRGWRNCCSHYYQARTSCPSWPGVIPRTFDGSEPANAQSFFVPRIAMPQLDSGTYQSRDYHAAQLAKTAPKFAILITISFNHRQRRFSSVYPHNIEGFSDICRQGWCVLSCSTLIRTLLDSSALAVVQTDTTFGRATYANL